MEELVLFNRRLKLIGGEVYSLKQNKIPYWYKIKLSINSSGYYGFKLTTDKKWKYYKFHRVVYKFHNRDWDMTYTPDNQIDHIDECITNNNIENLRVVNHSENGQNSSKTKGYSWNKSISKWRAQIMINNKTIYLGGYDTEEEARAAYLNAKKIHHTH
tara:strand:- start:32 stop:505 length:474 start_codon:yes stop_codon:yes gene_type:complete